MCVWRYSRDTASRPCNSSTFIFFRLGVYLLNFLASSARNRQRVNKSTLPETTWNKAIQYSVYYTIYPYRKVGRLFNIIGLYSQPHLIFFISHLLLTRFLIFLFFHLSKKKNKWLLMGGQLYRQEGGIPPPTVKVNCTTFNGWGSKKRSVAPVL